VYISFVIEVIVWANEFGSTQTLGYSTSPTSLCCYIRIR